MSIEVAIAAATAAYVFIAAFVVYFCMLADPETSPLAEFLTETMPQRAWDASKKVLGDKNMGAVEWVTDRLMILTYIVIVFGSWSIIFAYVYPWVDNQSYLSHYHKTVGYIVFAACVTSWRYATTSSPGLITRNNLKLYDHFPYDELMFASGKTCRTRKIPRLARSKFDRFKYKENVPRFDHFCGWVFNTIGEENYRWFLLFLAVHVGMCSYGTLMLYYLFRGHLVEKGLMDVALFNRRTGEEIPPGNLWILSNYLFQRFTFEAGVLMLMAVMAVCLGLFLLYHIWITSRGLTTNECSKWDEIRKWHKTELKRYQTAVKEGKIVEKAEKAVPPTPSDGDVTCTPGSGSSGKETEENSHGEDDEDDICDPGPPPKNIYNRGFVENWREVIFPISLRKQQQMKAEASKNKDN